MSFQKKMCLCDWKCDLQAKRKEINTKFELFINFFSCKRIDNVVNVGSV